ncbi:hypothetical protein OHR68_43345 [Spirillospora sp. NBC_00431]
MPEKTTPVPGAEVGERVILTAPIGDKRVPGVLLPPAKAGEPHRVDPDEGQAVLLLDGTWLAAPERPAADRKKDRRRRYCDDGRPIYRHGDLPARQLATQTMLKARRRRPAEGQQPVASYMVHRGYAPLYAVTDTDELPPLPPARRAAWDQARTCARCKATRERPFTTGPDGARYCEDCHEPAARDHWVAQRAEGRLAAKAWAHGVLGFRPDPNVVLLKSGTTWPWFELRAETLTGEVLLAAEVYGDPVCGQDWRTDEEWAEFQKRFTLPAEAVEPLRALEGRRLITWRNDLWTLRLHMKELAGVDLALTVADGDQVGAHYDEWIAERAHTGWRSYWHNQSMQPQQPPTGWDSEVAGIRAALHAMATGEPPALPVDEQDGNRNE